MKTKWNETPTSHKIAAVFSIVVSLAVVVLSVIQIIGNVWDGAINLCIPLLGVQLLCQAYIQWNANRKIAFFSIGVAAFILICAIVVFFF